MQAIGLAFSFECGRSITHSNSRAALRVGGIPAVSCGLTLLICVYAGILSRPFRLSNAIHAETLPLRLRELFICFFLLFGRLAFLFLDLPIALGVGNPGGTQHSHQAECDDRR